MPAHVARVVWDCPKQGCTKLATHEVRNGWNSTVMRGCEKHCTELRDHLLKAEDHARR